MFEAPPLPKLQEAIADPTNPIGMRMRAAYFLRQAYENYKKNQDDTEEHHNKESTTKQIDEIVIETLSQGLANPQHGSLLRHEFAYVMGQLRDARCCPTIEQILLNDKDCIMVRHECGEALGAIGSMSSLPILQQAIRDNPDRPEIGQTCQLAVDYMNWKANGGEENDGDQPMVCACMLSPYSSVDPAPPHPQHINMSTDEIGNILRDEDKPLFERYRAMFSLRNRGGSDAVKELGRALLEDTSSALFRHEVAYVLGQMQHNDSLEALAESLKRKDEHHMVRHESAEALGAIEGRWDEVEAILETFLKDEDDVIRESAIVALDAADYWGHGSSNNREEDDEESKEAVEYADTTQSFADKQSFVKVKAQKV